MMSQLQDRVWTLEKVNREQLLQHATEVERLINVNSATERMMSQLRDRVWTLERANKEQLLEYAAQKVAGVTVKANKS
jgi:hypothetical protein